MAATVIDRPASASDGVTTRSDQGSVVSEACFTEVIDTEGNTMPTVIHRTRDELQAQRSQLLEEVHMSYEELRQRAETYSLSLDDLDVWHTIEGIDYLLDGEC